MRNRWIRPDHLAKIMSYLDDFDRTVCTLCTETGYRIDDILSIKQYQATKAMETGHLTLHEQKTGKTRTVEMSPQALGAILRLYLRYTTRKHPLMYLFPSRTHRKRQKRAKIHRSTIHRHFHAAVKAAGLTGCGYTIHSLRKVYARRLYEMTGSMLTVMKDLGHDNVGTTSLYVWDLD